ncbi:DEAD/DEAH box helicase [Synechococcales cyanobacterium C]|uniref:RNA helicase n=1 Tax=Petrachloros mirabilis ULC683 TaxID=2781853 RepID=A0A8K2A247_9CYAN|nr:DEAD/DEAH box helicase [Petrachloros mirabilis]NCJ08333.1 DEAD/DEAH box helicase [Petrachloros mirabilis ULC683]
MTLSFPQLGLSQHRVDCLEALGFTTPTDIQAQAIPLLLEGKDMIGQAQTGTGKTAAFSLPILERIDATSKATQALILTPTRELAVQVCEAIESFKGKSAIKVLAIYGGQSIERQMSQLRRGVQVVVGTPGRVMDLMGRGAIDFSQISWFVLDEADEMLNMGFIPDVRQILSQIPEQRQMAFFSATMDPVIYKLAKQFLRSPVTITVEQPKAAPARINQIAYKVPRTWARATMLQAVLELEDPETALVFVRTRREAASLTQQLQASGYSVDEYHGDLNQSQRERLLDRFRQRQIRWVIATDIAARGIHVDDLSHVINYDLPDANESYVHRIGRTGRAGNEGTAISLVHPTDFWRLREVERHIRQKITLLDAPTRSQIEARRLAQLQRELHGILTGERLASFLPVVSHLSEEYDTHAIAAAALQMAFDRYPAITTQLDSWEPADQRERALDVSQMLQAVSTSERR